jgi:hypothetical protein
MDRRIGRWTKSKIDITLMKEDGQTDRWVNRRVDRWRDSWTDKLIDRKPDGRGIDGQTNKWMIKVKGIIIFN